jgi:deazaflavin-dependent oxidoreductase (nitroreductase family)
VSFDAVSGTRGRRVTTIGGPVGRWMTQLVVSGIRRTGKVPILGFNAVALTTTGARSGLRRTTPVGLFPGEDGSWLIVASAAGGRKNPAWYHNLAAHPGQVQIEAAGQMTAVVAEQLRGAERDQAWQQITTAAPRYAKDAAKTDRKLPIIRLVARTDHPAGHEPDSTRHGGVPCNPADRKPSP